MIRYQPKCNDTTINGELVWDFLPMERWQELQLFKRSYSGGFLEQWWHLNAYARGEILGYEEHEADKTVFFRQYSKEEIAWRLERAMKIKEEVLCFPVVSAADEREDVGQIYAYGGGR